MDRERLIEAFYEMWDAFPGMARLISSNHEILAANDIAVNRGFIPGEICARVGKFESHMGSNLSGGCCRCYRHCDTPKRKKSGKA